MYTDNNNVYHLLLDLKLGLPIALKSASEVISYYLPRKYNERKFELMRTLLHHRHQ